MALCDINAIIDLLMLELLKNLYLKIEGLKGKKLIIVLAVVFVSFTIIGISVGYFMTRGLKENEKPKNSGSTFISPKSEKTYYEGKITYVNPQLYPLDDVSYALTDSSGKELFLLKADDQKLAIAENLNVKVTGRMEKLSDGKTDVLMVEEVVIKNVSN